MDCIFCKIIAGEIPSVKVHEDDAALAFMDINPLTEGHCLVAPKRHVETLYDADAEVLARTMGAVHRVARGLRAALAPEGLNVLQANGRAAAQTVPHLHFHLIPRRHGDGAGIDWTPEPGDAGAIRAVGERIAREVG